MDRPVSVALVGISGYGRTYLDCFLETPAETGVELVACMDTNLERCEQLDELKARGVPLFTSYEELLAQPPADLVVISSPIHCHCPQTVAALAHGSNVLCEKPLAATIQEARQMVAAEQTSGKFAAIGYQWSFAAAVQALKADILAGRFGAPRRMKTACCWPRARGYYERNSWAGMLATPRGEWVLDSPINNATAHYLHNMLYILGDQVHTSAVPVSVTGELYRANPITNFDYGALRCMTDKGVEILFWSAHCIETQKGPIASYEFEEATVNYLSNPYDAPFIATFKDGTTKDYGSPNVDQRNKFRQSVEACRSGAQVACSVATASAQTLVMNGLQDSMPEIVEFPAALVKRVNEEKDPLVCVDGVFESIWECYEKNLLPSELGCSWAKAGQTIDLTGYKAFPGVPRS